MIFFPMESTRNVRYIMFNSATWQNVSQFLKGPRQNWLCSRTGTVLEDKTSRGAVCVTDGLIYVLHISPWQ